jgi:riboflavin kinase/FMN adenylyltransferase
MQYFNPKDIVIGFNHHFGKDKEGNEVFLEDKSKTFNYNLHVINPFSISNITVSSSLIRNYINSYKIASVSRLLGREYELVGLVKKGNGIGRKINFPTANLKPVDKDQLIPPSGVYCVDAVIDKDKYLAMCNIGCRPTFSNEGIKVIEVHIFSDNYLELFNKEVKIIFKGFLRKEKKYNNAKELVQQLEEDKRECIKNYKI